MAVRVVKGRISPFEPKVKGQKTLKLTSLLLLSTPPEILSFVFKCLRYLDFGCIYPSKYFRCKDDCCSRLTQLCAIPNSKNVLKGTRINPVGTHCLIMGWDAGHEAKLSSPHPAVSYANSFAWLTKY